MARMIAIHSLGWPTSLRMVAKRNHHIKTHFGIILFQDYQDGRPSKRRLLVTSTYSDSYQLLLSLLVEARKEAKLTQTLLSARLGKPQSFVSKYERGERRLDVIEFLNVCRQLGADPYKMIHTLENVSPT